jgi:enterochelin esterase-like enzyme
MKRLFIILFAILLCSKSFAMSNDLRIMESLVMTSKVLGQDVKYSICLPKDYYKGNKTYPVVYLLHGLGDDETSWLEYGGISQIADKLVKDNEIDPMIFVIPQGYRTYYVNDFAGNFRYQDMFIQELIPFIDSHYRTIADKEHRATMGYSMGGFGALILPLKNPNVISNCVPLSISIRTDQQYMVEDASEWNKQWGSLFGGVGKTGEDRITEYYKQNCPFYIFSQNDLSKLKELKIYIDNGDDEKTLCRSNEELHILLRDKGISHEFRVRDGGHSFQYWYSALPNALRFIDDAFDSKPYRGDIKNKQSKNGLPEKQLQYLTINNDQVLTFVPSEYISTNRLYPVIYFSGSFTLPQNKSIAALINNEIENNDIPPMILVFLPENGVNKAKEFLPAIEEKLRIRKGYRFRALAGYQDRAFNTFKEVIISEQFSSCILSDAYLLKDSVLNFLSKLNPEKLKRASIIVYAPDRGKYYNGNGNLHMLLRDKEIQHEYRVMEGDGGFDWFLAGLPEMISLTAKRFHR